MGACSQFGIVVHCRTSGMNSVPHWAFTCLHLPQAAAGSALGAAKPPLRITHEGDGTEAPPVADEARWRNHPKGSIANGNE